MNVKAHKRFRHPVILQFLKDSISLNITPKKLNIWPYITCKFHQLFSCLESIHI